MNEEEIDKIIKQCFGLIDRQGAKEILLAKINEKQEYIQLNKVDNLRCITKGYVSHIFITRKKDEKIISKRIILEWAGFEKTVVFFNDLAKKAEELFVGDLIEINDVYLKNNEIFVGYAGEIKYISKMYIQKFKEINTIGQYNIIGFVSNIFEDYFYEKSNKKMKSFEITDGKNHLRCIVFLENFFKTIESLNRSDEIILHNVVYKNNEIHFNDKSKIEFIKKSNPDEISGEVTDISAKTIQIDKKNIYMDENQIRQILEIYDNILFDIDCDALIRLKDIRGKVFLNLKTEKIEDKLVCKEILSKKYI